MRICCALVMALAVVSAPAVTQAAPIPTQPVYTNKAKFRIPYRYDPVEMQKLGAREIRLYMSTDQGRQWQLAQTVDPRARKFDFEAAADGEYWFAVRTLDARNTLHPQGEAVEPGLRVVVDTAAPSFSVTLQQIEPGRVELAWSAQDEHLDLTTMRLEYLQTGAANWDTVSIVPQPSGRTSWTTPQGGIVEVRGTVSDLAGNAQTAQARAQVAAGNPAARPAGPDFRQPIASQPVMGLAANLPNSIPGHLAPAPMPGVPQPGALDVPAPAAEIPQGLPLTSVSSDPQSRPDILQGRYPQNVTDGASSRTVNARKFQINYQIDEVGPSGVQSVELYITEDGGRKWFKYGNDPDVNSPFPVEVPRDGVYGFALRVRSGAGLAADPPLPGERPSIVITVDTLAPSIALMPPQQGSGANLNKITVSWQITEDHPAEASVLLSTAGDPAGPWEPLGTWMADTGSHSWTVGPGTPSRLYVRLTARDAAGNVSQMDTPQPILVDLTRPTARIVDVEAVGTPNFRP